jgi:flagellum-specific peptidoglycan hydrolase FlgJ
MSSAGKPWWVQATPLISVSASGALIGFSFVPGTAAGLTSPSGLPHLLALEKVVQSPAAPSDAATAHSDAAHSDTALRSAIVNVARYYLRMAQSRTSAQMEAVIWGADSVNGADHGAWCAAFASMTLELGAQSVGQQSWVTGGGTYPWPLHEWADVRVDPNPESPGIISVLQDAESHGRWHPLGDGYTPQPGDWVMFDEHVEVVTGYADGVLSTIGANSLPGLTVNAHEFGGSLAARGVQGFVDNGGLPAAGATITPVSASGARGSSVGARGSSVGGSAGDVGGAAAIPGALDGSSAAVVEASGQAAIPGASVEVATAVGSSASSAYGRHQSAAAALAVPETVTQQAFISAVAPGAMAAQARYGVPAAVTIAQAIDESGWGQSELAVKDHNLFGIKGSGPAGTDAMATQEFLNGSWVTSTAYFRVYHNVAESIADHGQLLATSPIYQRAMADRAVPDAFANDLTGVYATDPTYGSTLIALMQLYDLYRYDDLPAAATATSPAVAASAPTPTSTSTSAVAAPTVTAPAFTAPALTVPAVGGSRGSRGSARIPGLTMPAVAVPRYQAQIPAAVTTAFINSARASIINARPLYGDVASYSGISWQLLAACDWMQCEARARYSPVHGERLGTLNPDGTAYHTKSEALAQCAADLIELSRTVYQIRIQGKKPLSVNDLANVFAAFRWGGLLRHNNVSAMEFPYSVQGLTAHHTKMRWPKIAAPDAPDRPGTRFKSSFGAVPIVLSLSYPATA